LASEWDPKGKYCKFQLTFDEPLTISQGDLPDNIKIYFYRQYFLREWTPSLDDLKVDDVCDYNCEEAKNAEAKAKADAAAAEEARLNPPKNDTASNATASNGTAAAIGKNTPAAASKETPPAAKKETGSKEERLLAQLYREKERRLKEAVAAADTSSNVTNATSLVNATFQGWSEDYLSNQDLYIILESDMPSMVRNKDELDFMTMLAGLISYILLAAFLIPIMIHFVI